MREQLIILGGFLLMTAGLVFIAAQNHLLGRMLAEMHAISVQLLKLH